MDAMNVTCQEKNVRLGNWPWSDAFLWLHDGLHLNGQLRGHSLGNGLVGSYFCLERLGRAIATLPTFFFLSGCCMAQRVVVQAVALLSD